VWRVGGVFFFFCFFSFSLLVLFPCGGLAGPLPLPPPPLILWGFYARGFCYFLFFLSRLDDEEL